MAVRGREGSWFALAVGVLVSAGSLAAGAQSAAATTRVARSAAVAKRPSADLLAVLTASPAPAAPAPNFTSMAASRSTVVAQGSVTDVFVEGVGAWRSTGPAATLVDPAAPAAPAASAGGTGVSISNDTVLAGFGSANGRSVEDVFVRPAGGWSGPVSPAARLAAPSGSQALINGAIAGHLIAAQTTSAQRPMGPVGVYPQARERLVRDGASKRTSPRQGRGHRLRARRLSEHGLRLRPLRRLRLQQA
jgi:hypothetical protein